MCPIAVSYFVCPPFMPEFMMKYPVKIFTAYFFIPVFISISNIGLMFHAKVWSFRSTDRFFYPWIFSKIFFLDPAGLLIEIKKMFCLIKIFFQHIIFNWYFIAINCCVHSFCQLIFSYIEKNTIIADGIISFPMKSCLII